MERPRAEPVVAIVGRPNVGKSTLFNRIVGQRRAIVGDEPGMTRDRIYGRAEHRGRPFVVVDTGGLLPGAQELVAQEVVRQAQQAIEEAAALIFVVDAREDLTPLDRELADLLRRCGKPVFVAVNKVDVPTAAAFTGAFYALGFREIYPISAEHGIGVDDMLDAVVACLPETPSEVAVETAPEELPQIKVAIIGRPNVGKSTLLNALTGTDRAIVSPIPGTTRDAVDEEVVVNGTRFVFVDTAGIRRKGKTKLLAEKLSVIMARRHIRLADVVLLVLDATEGIVNLDATIGGYAHEAGRAIILCVNKWDAAPSKDKAAFVERVRAELRFLEYAPIAFLSAERRAGLSQLFPLIRRCYEAASRRIPTAELNRFFQSLELPPELRGRYITQVGIRPPTFVVFAATREPLHFSIERYLINRIREAFDFFGTPIRIKVKPKRGAREPSVLRPAR